MKLKNIIISTLGVAALSLAGCDPNLDVVNSDKLNINNMWTDQSDVEGATYGIYDRLRTAFTDNYANHFFWGELRVGPAMWDRGTSRLLMDNNMLAVLHSTLNSSNSSDSWTKLYTCINQCNSVIKYAPEVSMTEASRNFCLGNAHFIRAYVYYWIARNWGDAPIVLAPTESTGSEIYPTRSPKANVYAQVAADIETALSYITDNTAGCYYATVDNINMLKTDFALWMYGAQKGGNSYLTMAETAIGEIGKAALLNNFADVFDVTKKKNNEIAFSIFCDNTSETHSAGYIQRFLWNPSFIKNSFKNIAGGVPVYSNQWFCYADEYIAEIKANKNDSNDQRSDVTYMELTNVSDNYEVVGWPNKYTGNWSSGTVLFDDDLIMYRYAQYYMFRAEYHYYKEEYAKALEQLNVVAKRAYGVENFYTSATKDGVLDALVKENRWEFACEGNLWFTYIRLGFIDEYCPLKYWSNTGVNGGVGGSANPNIYLFPISASSINKNTNLKQTQGWS